MAIFDPTQQIKDLAKRNTDTVNTTASAFNQQARNRTAQTERLMSQIQAIRDEAHSMHKEFLQEEIDSLQGELSDHIFKQRKNGAKIDISGFEGLNQKMSKIKNMATNSQYAAELGTTVSQMIMNDKYVISPDTAIGTVMSTISDKAALTLNPKDLSNSLTAIYTGSVDQISKATDLIKSQYDARQEFRQVTEGGKVYDVQFEVRDQFQDQEGNLLSDAVSKIKTAVNERGGFDLNDEQARIVAQRLGASVSRKRNYDEEKMQMQRDAIDLKREAENKGRISKGLFFDGYSTFVNGVTSGNLNQAVKGSGAKERLTYITKKDIVDLFNEDDKKIPEAWQVGLDSLPDDAPVGITNGKENYPLSEDGLKQAYRNTVNSWVNDDFRASLTSYNLDESNIEGAKMLNQFFETNGITIPVDTNWNVMTESLIKAYPGSKQKKEEKEEESQESKEVKGSESTFSIFEQG